MSTLDVLIAARAKIDRGWCKGAWAQDSMGRACGATSQRAQSWCLLGAVLAAEGHGGNWLETHTPPALFALQDANPVGGPWPLWNDAQESVRPILALLNHAIAAERAKQEGAE